MPGNWRNVDWLVVNVQASMFWHQSDTGNFFLGIRCAAWRSSAGRTCRLIRDSINADMTWRAGEWSRFLAEASYNMDDSRLETFAEGIAIDQSPDLSYFFGNRYIRQLDTDEWTIGMNYALTRKYSFLAVESYDTGQKNNVLSSFTLLRKLPRFNMAATVTYDANQDDTTFIASMWPERPAGAGRWGTCGGCWASEEIRSPKPKIESMLE